MMKETTDVRVGGLCCVLEMISRKEASSEGIEWTRAEADNTGGESNKELLDETSETSSWIELDLNFYVLLKVLIVLT